MLEKDFTHYERGSIRRNQIRKNDSRRPSDEHSSHRMKLNFCTAIQCNDNNDKTEVHNHNTKSVALNIISPNKNNYSHLSEKEAEIDAET